MDSALEVLKQRLKQKNKTGSFSDNHKMCLTVEGGGMRGVVSTGMLMAMKDLDLLDLFDIYIGSSSGSINLAYTLAGYPEGALSVYYDHMVNNKIVDTFRVVKGDYVIDLKSLERIVSKFLPSPVDNLMKTHPDNFFMTITALDPARGKLLSTRDAQTHFIDYLIASATIPYIAGRPRKIDKTKYCDGGFAYPNLTIAAQELDCSHVFSLSSSPHKSVVKKYDSLSGKSYKTLLSSGYKNLEKFWEERLSYGEDLKKHSNQIKVQSVAIGHLEHRVGTFSNDQWLLIDGARKGYEAVVKLFMKDATIGLVPEIL